MRVALCMVALSQSPFPMSTPAPPARLPALRTLAPELVLLALATAGVFAGWRWAELRLWLVERAKRFPPLNADLGGAAIKEIIDKETIEKVAKEMNGAYVFVEGRPSSSSVPPESD